MEHLIKQSLTRSLTDIVNGSEHIRKTLEVFSNQTTGEYNANIFLRWQPQYVINDFMVRSILFVVSELRQPTSSPKRNTSTVVTNNVNHVHPMIKGITIKKPVIRISRAIFEPDPIGKVFIVMMNNTSSLRLG